MKNTFVLTTKRDFNPFTLTLKARCQAEGEVLVRMRNGDYCKVVYRPANADEFEDEAFHKKDHSAFWEPSGHSVTADRYDLVEFDDPASAPDVDHVAAREKDPSGLLDLLELRVAMAAEGWMSEDKVSTQGWDERPGYSIWFKRYDWHGQRTMALTGSAATYHAHTPDPGKAFEAAVKAAELARRAWREFPDCPPSQTVDYDLAARMRMPG
ncbi:hypothetical protein [Burkholderia ubonensis]|uniref:hypothetical protein n=1 Tax=Burkholderia ubonensis TaxID=101571 RepID=UPI00075F2987|nr:hypothetical protein [Burkholderia ubonensis]KVP75190.1 hypothetical protein WJ93_07170 [Burkholderia ubonensis]